jgi:cytoskeleton protein RodZ
MGTVASELKAERERLKIPLSQIAAETRISLRHLESLEEGRYRDMPGGLYTRSFLKAYCEILNLNLPEIMQRYENEIALIPEKSFRTRTHVPQRRRSFSISPIFVWGVMLAILVGGLYFGRKWITAVFSPHFSHAPTTAVRYETAQTPAIPTPSVTEAPVVEPPSQPAASPGSTVPGSLNLPSTTSVTPQAILPIGANVLSALPATPPALQMLRLEINATEICWVSLERDGTSVFRRNMQPGEVQFFDAAERFIIIVGNASGVRLKINGKPAKTLGKSGAVVRILIDGRNLPDLLDQTAG